MAFRELHPLSVFLFDLDARAAAAALCDVHVRSQACALARETYQIALATGADVTGFPRAQGAYPPRPLSLAGSWACVTTANWVWWANYCLGVMSEYTLRFGARHEAEGRLWWLFDRMGCPAPRGGLWVPTVPGETCADLDGVVFTSRILYAEENARAAYSVTRPPAWMVRGSGPVSLTCDPDIEAAALLPPANTHQPLRRAI